jgi:hypothetical protein
VEGRGSQKAEKNLDAITDYVRDYVILKNIVVWARFGHHCLIIEMIKVRFDPASGTRQTARIKCAL